MGPDCPLCIPSTILCAKVPSVVLLCCSPCYPTCPRRTAIARSPAGISIQWSGGYRSEDNDADDGFWNPLLESVNGYERELVRLPDFRSIHLFFGRAEVQRSRSCHCGANGGSSFDVDTEILFQENCSFRLSYGLAWFAWCCDCKACRRSTALATPYIRCWLLKPSAMQVWNRIWIV